MAAIDKRREEFFRKASKKHNDYYDYSKSVYVRSKDKVIIICPEHGEFLQAPNNHVQGQGCPVCADNQRQNLSREHTRNMELHLHITILSM